MIKIFKNFLNEGYNNAYRHKAFLYVTGLCENKLIEEFNKLKPQTTF